MAGGSFGAACGAPPAAPASSSTGSANSYNGDDARHFLHQWNETCNLYSGTTREIGRLELCLDATQAALLAAKGETSAIRTMPANADARVVGKILHSNGILIQ